MFKLPDVQMRDYSYFVDIRENESTENKALLFGTAIAMAVKNLTEDLAYMQAMGEIPMSPGI